MNKNKKMIMFIFTVIISLSFIALALTQISQGEEPPIPTNLDEQAPDLVVPEIPFGTLGLMTCFIVSLSVYYFYQKRK